jgi:single-stranded-DNA-specific exonuclease
MFAYLSSLAPEKEGCLGRRWTWPGSDDQGEAEQLARWYGMPRAVAATLARRGLADRGRLDDWLNPSLRRLADPRDLWGMAEAVARVGKALETGETIFVHGDYDVDGITGTAFLTRTLTALDGQVVPFVPSRADGYGIGPVGLAAAREAGATLMITVDTGVRAVNEIEEAQASGIDVVVLDHHQPGDLLPAATSIVNPHCHEGGDAFRDLSAVGVAAKFVHALGTEHPSPALREAYREALQLVAMGTIADVMPLVGENRILVSYGLARLARSRWPGVRALLAVAGLRAGKISGSDVAFFIAPRLNAAGRMGEARDALELLLCDDPEEAYRLAGKLEVLNRERRAVEQRVGEDAAAALGAREERPPAAVLWSNDWPVGVIGIAASRILDRFHVPALLIAMKGDEGRGSARSRSPFLLPEALAACDDLLTTHGGHAQAAGFSIRREYLEPFRTRIESLAGERRLPAEGEPLEVDAAVGLDEMNPECVQWLDRLAPFGRGNPEPLFGAKGLVLAETPSLAGKSHLRLVFGSGKRRVRAIAFNQGNRLLELDRGTRLDALFHASFDTWRGGHEVQLVVRDLQVR